MNPSEQAAAVLLRRLAEPGLSRVERARACGHLAKLAEGVLSACAPVSLRAAALQWDAKARAAIKKVSAEVEQLRDGHDAANSKSSDAVELARAAAIWVAALEEMLSLPDDVLAFFPVVDWRDYLDAAMAERAVLLDQRERARGAA